MKKDQELLEEIRQKYNLPLVDTAGVRYKTENRWASSKNHRAIIDVETGGLFGIQSDQYRLVRHEEGLVLMDEAIQKNPEFGQPEYNVDLYEGGRRAKVTARFPEVEFPVTNEPGDITNPTLEYFNSYDGGWSERVILGAYRLVCKNGLTVGKKFFMERVVHRGKRPQEFLMGLDKAMDNFSMQVGLWKEWSEKELSIGQLDSGLEPFAKKQREEILFDADNQNDLNNLSVWIFYNLLTACITHRVGSLNRQVALQESLRRATERW